MINFERILDVYSILDNIILEDEDVICEVYNLLNPVFYYWVVLTKLSDILPKRVNMMTSVNSNRINAFNVKIINIFFQKLSVINQIFIF